MPVDLTHYILPQGNLMSNIPQETWSEIRSQSVSGESLIRLGNLMVSIRPMQIDGYFIGRINNSALSEGDTRLGHQYIDNIERTLNVGGLSSREVEVLREIEELENMTLLSNHQSDNLLGKIELCSFNVENEKLEGSVISRTCPITLCEPEKGVFMRNSMSSDVCTLYDKTALINLIDMKAPHPLSRETITASMIIGKDECYFVPDRESFILKES
ncbi:T3SS effector NleG family protein [Escherichia albertii]|uniref:T3SS effector NleG family protein n=1 Tax=Escherichia albertii TaxID=208962 RepID=UPI0009308CA9|nr:T3SS effector NleG family protein [Escherichia albertii]EHQ8142873.1 T3SS effector NleG family protein [Escherichia albertii]MCZ9121970.1 T3SS effector NleG family protein [Escherichia albertii]QTA10122.1 DUF1076 domain-containing protein [Escherichia albertii]